MNLEDKIDRLIHFFTQSQFEAELKAARHDFFDAAGILDEADQGLELRMTQFLDWYLLTRKMVSTGLVPAEYALELAEFVIEPNEMPVFESIAIAHHSLFEYITMRGASLYFADLFLDREVVIEDSPLRVGFNRSEIFEARLVLVDGKSCFTKGFCFHPAEATPYIKSEVRSVGRWAEPSMRDRLMLKLMKMRYKYEHYRHLKLEHFYTNEKRAKL